MNGKKSTAVSLPCEEGIAKTRSRQNREKPLMLAPKNAGKLMGHGEETSSRVQQNI